MDLFELLKNKIGCDYISDLKQGNNREMAIRILNNSNYKNHYQYNDICNYLNI